MQSVTLRLRLSSAGIALQMCKALLDTRKHRSVNQKGNTITTLTTLDAAVEAIKDKRIKEFTITGGSR
jgi:hypothetical protein